MMYVWSEDKISDIPNIEDNGNKVYPLTQEERDALEGYIRSCDTFMMLDQEVRNIVLEEADEHCGLLVLNAYPYDRLSVHIVCIVLTEELS